MQELLLCCHMKPDIMTAISDNDQHHLFTTYSRLSLHFLVSLFIFATHSFSTKNFGNLSDDIFIGYSDNFVYIDHLNEVSCI